MESFAGKIAVVTGGGSGMGRELVRQLAAEGCSVATCDVHRGAVAETEQLASEGAPAGTKVTSHSCDVADEAQVLRFRDEVLAAHAADHVDLVFSNAGIGGGEGVLVNTSSVNGFWASLGQGVPHTAYSTAKFAVKGFSEALIEDLRVHAPHVRVAVVMPGHVATNIVANSMMAFGVPEADALAANQGFHDSAPLSAAGAATVILDGVRSGAWRILVGADAVALDGYVRAHPDGAYDYAKLTAAATEAVGKDPATVSAEWFDEAGR